MICAAAAGRWCRLVPTGRRTQRRIRRSPTVTRWASVMSTRLAPRCWSPRLVAERSVSGRQRWHSRRLSHCLRATELGSVADVLTDRADTVRLTYCADMRDGDTRRTYYVA